MFLPAICETLPNRQGFLRKSILVAFLLITLPLLSTLPVLAENSVQGISFSGENIPLQKVFKKITKLTGYSVFCDYRLLQQAGPVTVNVKNASLEEALAVCLKDKSLSFEIIGKTIVISSKVTTVSAPPADAPPGPPPIDVRGRVTDEQGDPV